MRKEEILEILEILENSQVLKVANLDCFSTRSDIYIKFNDMNKNPKVFNANTYLFGDKFVLKSFCDKTNLSYEHVKHQDLNIEVLNLKTFFENIEILSAVTNDDKNLTINISDNKSNAVFGIGNNTISFGKNSHGHSMKLCYDFSIKDIVRYQEKNEKSSFYIKLVKEDRKINLITYNTNNDIVKNNKKIIPLKNTVFDNAIYDFTYNEHIITQIEYILDVINQKLPNAIKEIGKYEVIDNLSLLSDGKDLLCKLFGKNQKISNIITSYSLLQTEKNNEKKLLIKK